MTPHCTLVGGTETPDSPAVGSDLGELLGASPLGAFVTADPLELFTRCEGILDFTTPPRPSNMPVWRRRRASST